MLNNDEIRKKICTIPYEKWERTHVVNLRGTSVLRWVCSVESGEIIAEEEELIINYPKGGYVVELDGFVCDKLEAEFRKRYNSTQEIKVNNILDEALGVRHVR